jgi:hypothetical protein
MAFTSNIEILERLQSKAPSTIGLYWIRLHDGISKQYQLKKKSGITALSTVHTWGHIKTA